MDTGGGHIGRNETSQPAKDVSVILAPVGLPFRGELAAPGTLLRILELRDLNTLVFK